MCLIVVFLVLGDALAGCGHRGALKGTVIDDNYTAPAGLFRCQVPGYAAELVDIKESLGPQSGVVRFYDPDEFLRVEFLNLESRLAGTRSNGKARRQALKGFFMSDYFSILSRNVPHAEILQDEFLQLQGTEVYLAAVRLPQSQEMPQEVGGRPDLFRGLLFDSDGTFLFVSSVDVPQIPLPRPAGEETFDVIRAKLLRAAERCRFGLRAPGWRETPASND